MQVGRGVSRKRICSWQRAVYPLAIATALAMVVLGCGGGSEPPNRNSSSPQGITPLPPSIKTLLEGRVHHVTSFSCGDPGKVEPPGEKPAVSPAIAVPPNRECLVRL